VYDSPRLNSKTEFELRKEFQNAKSSMGYCVRIGDYLDLFIDGIQSNKTAIQSVNGPWFGPSA
jgi:hypothetical protein